MKKEKIIVTAEGELMGSKPVLLDKGELNADWVKFVKPKDKEKKKRLQHLREMARLGIYF